MNSFGHLLGHLRRRARLGLRSFAELVDERASTVSALELGLRSPWHRTEKLAVAANVLGLSAESPEHDAFFRAARQSQPTCAPQTPGQLGWWWTTDRAQPLHTADVLNLAEFIGARPVGASATAEELAAAAARELSRYPALTELAAEWRVRQLLGPGDTPLAAAPVDVEAVLEHRAGVRIEIVPGLIPNFSVQACAVLRGEQLTLLVDRIVADSRPLAAYRELLARCYAPRGLWIAEGETLPAAWFLRLQASEDWPQLVRDCQRFALAMLLPAPPLLTAAATAYREVVQHQGWVTTDVAACAVRNRLAEQFAVPPLLVHSRLVRWPCHLYGRIAQALSAEEQELPPVDWFLADLPPHQGLLFEKALPQIVRQEP